jgi:hypothetical protein
VSDNLFVVDDKYVPFYRVLWVAKTPHYCGEDDCQREGYYEVRLEDGESVWAKLEERDALLEALDTWCGGEPPPDEDWR